jgi:hypothetical protein
MNIENKGTYYSNDQLEKIIKKMALNTLPNELIICEKRKDLFHYIRRVNVIDRFSLLLDITIWSGKVEGIYFEKSKTIFIFVFSQTDDGLDYQSKQLYSLHSLTHEMRHVWQQRNNFTKDVEEDADHFATKFINSNSEYLSKVMKWEDEWEVEEE